MANSFSNEYQMFSQLDIQKLKDDADYSNYQRNGEFSLENYTATRHSIIYSCCPDAPFPDLTYYVALRRRPMFYVFNLILPCVLINGIGKRMSPLIKTFKNIYRSQKLLIFFNSHMAFLPNLCIVNFQNYALFRMWLAT